MFAVLTITLVPGADLQGPPQLLNERFRRREMFDHVEQQDVVIVRGIQWRHTVVEIVKHERVQLHVRAEWKLVDASDPAVPLTAQHGADVSARAAEIEHPRALGHDLRAPPNAGSGNRASVRTARGLLRARSRSGGRTSRPSCCVRATRTAFATSRAYLRPLTRQISSP